MRKRYEYGCMWIEITRKCNLKCVHCSNGEAQDIDISTEIIDRIFEDTKDCKNIILTGGEPLLCMDLIEYVINQIDKCQWHTNYLELTTNGTVRDEKIVKLLSQFCAIRKGNTAILRVSNDEFHNVESSEQTLEFYKELCQNALNIEVKPTGKLDIIILRGRAKHFIEIHPEIAEKYLCGCIGDDPDYRIETVGSKASCAIAVRANGNVGLAEQLDYDTADATAFGNICNQSLSDLIDNHNDKCLITYGEFREYSAAENSQYIWTLQSSHNIKNEVVKTVNNYIIPLKIKSQFDFEVYKIIFALRQKARKLYANVSAEDIIGTLSIDMEKELQNVEKAYPMLSIEELTKHVDQDVLTEINEFVKMSTSDPNIKIFAHWLLGVAYITQKLKKLDANIGSDEQLPQFQRLRELNTQYQAM